MLDNHGFDLWADGYDASVNASDEDNSYPFAGYKKMLNAIYGAVMARAPASVLDIGIGTGTLATRLYEGGNAITGIDFSQKMLDAAQVKMLDARLIAHDFSRGLPQALAGASFDFIISTYALHHLEDGQKVSLIKQLLGHLNEKGVIIIGDVGFPDRLSLEKCRADHGEDEWDDEEFYFVCDELRRALGDTFEISFTPFSFCAGVMMITAA